MLATAILIVACVGWSFGGLYALYALAWAVAVALSAHRDGRP